MGVGRSFGPPRFDQGHHLVGQAKLYRNRLPEAWLSLETSINRLYQLAVKQVIFP
jgi:hypothetical protein